jgi:ribosomal protein L36
MSYSPQIDDYVIWNKGIEGWVYFRCKEYVTIETSVRPKDPEDYAHSLIHRNERLLVICYSNQWNELTYTHSR